ncbi:GAF domain-containing protein [Deinococcus pimensis]|uniref:GAF domain-containing protein n=1 Tax=Deinococcus pimensis TaxID=309888 RepID=UPI0004ADEF18|nr:GAF domain-containing protein [Deinococcus pimensis]
MFVVGRAARLDHHPNNCILKYDFGLSPSTAMTSSREPFLPHPLLALIDESDDALFTLDTEGRFTYANPAAAAIVDRTPDALIGRSLERDFPHAFNPHWLTASREARDTGRSVHYEAYNPTLGGPVHVHITPGRAGLAVRIRDVTQTRRTLALQQITAALAGARTTDDVTHVLIQQAVTAAGAYMGCLLVPTPDREALTILDSIGYTPPLLERFERIPLTLDLPGTRAANERTAVFVGGEALDEGYPASLDVRAHRTRSLAALPLTVHGDVWGVLALSFLDDRHFDEHEREFLRTLVRQAQSALERLDVHARQQAQSERLATLNRVGRAISAELDLNRLVQTVTDAGVELTGAAFGAFFYNVVNARQESYTLYTLSGVPHEAFASFPMPRNTHVFGLTFRGEGVLRSADITKDERYGRNAPYHGMPQGHLRVRSYLAVPVTSRSGEVLGGLFFGHPDVSVFTEEAEQLAVGLAAQTAVAIDNARLYGQLQDSHATLERRVLDRTRALEEERAALDAFAAFTERSATTTDVLDLARNATQVLKAALGDVSVAYYELDGDLWKARVLSDDVAPEVRRAAETGFPTDTPSFAETVETRDVLFVDDWNARKEGADVTEAYGAAALRPYFLHDQPYSLFTMGSTRTRVWSARDRAVFQAVTRSLGLAFERAEQTARLEAQNALLTLRTRALEAFAQLTRDLTLDADDTALVRRAQEILLSLLGDGYVLYWILDGERWRNVSLVGALGDPGLEDAVAAGFTRGRTPTLDTPWDALRPLFQDEYARGADTDPDVVRHVGAVAMLPVVVGGAPHGLIGLGLFERRVWSNADRAVLETVTRSLSLALEGARSTLALRERTTALERSNRELERFAFVASHDLQEPLRTIASFSELIDRRYAPSLDDTGRKYLSLVTRSAERMKALIDDLLVFSRLNTIKEPFAPVGLNDALTDALARLAGLVDREGATVHAGVLPVVHGSRSELTQLLQNLVGNAVKFRREGVPPEVRVDASRDGEAWHVRVSDNGEGFEAQYAERIFGMFQRLQGRDRVDGTGLGLAIVRKIAEHHGGRVWADSTPGEGSIFHVLLPGGTPDDAT